jgi:prepilin-type N-terminal cleavage/methylation domain-containing protein
MTLLSKRQSGPRPGGSAGFTLLELLVALSLLTLVVGGVAAAFSTSLATWRLGQERADLGQEARSILGLIARDLRAAYLGPADSPAGLFVTDETGLRFTTASARFNRMTYSTFEPGQFTGELGISDQADVKYFVLSGSDALSAGFYRVERVLPPYENYDVDAIFEPDESDLVSPNVIALEFRYFDSEQWNETWDTTPPEVEYHRLPWTVAVELVLRDPEDPEKEHVYQTIVPVALGHG